MATCDKIFKLDLSEYEIRPIKKTLLSIENHDNIFVGLRGHNHITGDFYSSAK